MKKMTEEQLLYTLGELLMIENEAVEDVRYTREAADCFFVTTKDGGHFRVQVREEGVRG